MTTTLVPDKGGNTIKLVEMDGFHYPVFPVESLKHTTTMKARPDDILIVTYPKAGTHWTFEIVRFLLAGTTDLPSVEKDDFMLEFCDPSYIQNLPSPRNLNSHFHHGVLSPDFLRQKSRIIYVTRNPRDIACSFFNHHKKLVDYYEYHGQWQDYFPLFLEGKVDYNSWFEYTKGWEKCMEENTDVPFLVLSYEGMHRDSLRAIHEIADFIGTSHSEDFLKEVQNKTTFSSMTQRKDGKAMYGYRKGKVGDWRNWFTVSQSDLFDEVFKREMRGTNAFQLYADSRQAPPADDNLNSD